MVSISYLHKNLLVHYFYHFSFIMFSLLHHVAKIVHKKTVFCLSDFEKFLRLKNHSQIISQIKCCIRLL